MRNTWEQTPYNWSQELEGLFNLFWEGEEIEKEKYIKKLKTAVNASVPGDTDTQAFVPLPCGWMSLLQKRSHGPETEYEIRYSLNVSDISFQK